jgi:nucleotide-binding universal stress UspA family protein
MKSKCAVNFTTYPSETYGVLDSDVNSRERILLIVTHENCGKAVEAAFNHARRTSGTVHVLQILTSDLYHHGHHDLVATRHSKRQFLLHIREEVLERGGTALQALEDHARNLGIILETSVVESENLYAASLSEAKKGYDVIFLPEQKRKLFPLFKRTLAEYLQRRLPGRIFSQ